MQSFKWLPNFIIYIFFTSALEPADIVVVILSQQDGYHRAHSNLLKDNIITEASALEKESPAVFLTHDYDIVPGLWTYLPLVPKLLNNYTTSKWFFFCQDNTAIKLNKLVETFSSLESQSEQELFIGHALYDKEPTIIHHFADQTRKLKYPHLGSGFAINQALMVSLNKRILTDGIPQNNFSIDASYELAKFIYNNGLGKRLTNSPEICVVSEKDCATYPRIFHSCSLPVLRENIYVAVKTYDKNHESRIPLITKTWTKFATNLDFFSNKIDKAYDNFIVVPDTNEGHCAKTYAILTYAFKILKRKKIDWLIVTDDDTILSIGRLTRLLTCYNPKNFVAIGERYGFRVTEVDGFEYLTGGAGVVLSAPLVNLMITSGACECPSSTTPDDMFLFGKCLVRIGVKPIHSELFHQARPSDYAIPFLAAQEPVSFHKFWMTDPIKIYDEWFAEADKSVLEESPVIHTEL